MSRRRCRQEGAAPPPSLRRLRSTPPVSLQSVRRVPACRAVRSVPRYPGRRAPPDRCPCRRPSPAIGIPRRRSGSRPRPARPARAERHSAALPPQSCRSRHEGSGADPAACPSTPTRNARRRVGARVGRELVAQGPDRHREIVAFDGRRPQALHRVPAFGDRLRRLFNRAIQFLFRLCRALGQQVRRRLESQQQTVEALKQRIVQLPGDSRALADARLERHVERVLHLTHPDLVRRPQQRQKQTHGGGAKQVGLYQGGVMTIGSDTPASFHTPSLFEPCTRNT